MEKWAYVPGVITLTLNPSMWKKAETDLCESEASLVYIVSSRIVKTTQ